MPYIIDSITAETINVNQELLVDGQGVPMPSYNNIGNSSENTEIDWSNGIIQELNLDNDPTLTFSNGLLGQTSTLLLKQQLSGLRFITWPNDVIWNGGNPIDLQTLAGAGSIDDSFNIGTGFSNYITSMEIQQDGKIVIGGDFTSYSGTSRNRIIRLNSDGSIDNSFNIGTGFNAYVDDIKIQPDGKIVVGGNFTSYNGTSRNRIIRLNSDGSIDNSFNIGTGFSGATFMEVNLKLQSDGKILVGGNFTSYNGTSVNRAARLNSDGSIDNTFTIEEGLVGVIYAIDVTQDGKIVIGGFFENYGGSNHINRLNSDGSIDNTFNVGTGFNDVVWGITIQSDGKILIGGGFTTYNGTSSNRIVRLNSDGSVDEQFNVSGNGFNGDNPSRDELQVWNIAVQEDGKILAGGFFSSYNGVTNNRIIRLNSDGSIDNSFDTGAGITDGQPYVIRISNNGKILVGGNLTNYNGTEINRLVSINGLAPLAYNKVEFDYNGIYYIGSY
jgi:uncharacterized delta-60 repeat protein